MKKLAYRTLSIIWLAAIALYNTACNDDGEGVTPSQRLTGTWSLQSSDVDFTINDQDYVTYIQQISGLSDDEKTFLISYIQVSLQEELIPQGTTFDFKADNNYEVKAPNETPETGTWSLNEDGTMLTIDGGTQDEIVFEVQSLTDTALTLFAESIEQDDFDQDGTAETFKTIITLNLSK